MNKLEKGLVVIGTVLGLSGIGQYVTEEMNNKPNTKIPIYLLINSYVFFNTAIISHIFISKNKIHKINYNEAIPNIPKDITEKDYNKL